MVLTHGHSVSTLRSAIELKSVFDQIQAAERAGNLSPEEKKKLEETAAEKGLQALFKVGSLPSNHLVVMPMFFSGSETRDRVRPAGDVRTRVGGPLHKPRESQPARRCDADARRGMHLYSLNFQTSICTHHCVGVRKRIQRRPINRGR